MGTKIKEFRQYNNLFTELVRKGIKLKYRRSYLGIVWSMIEPLLTMIVLTLDRKSTRLNSSHKTESRMPSSA